jgi:hypothetical protein
MSNPFDGDGPKKPDGPVKIGLAAPRPLTSVELAEKYAGIRHDTIEILWPTQFLDADGHLEPLTTSDIRNLTKLGVTIEEFYAVELSRT